MNAGAFRERLRTRTWFPHSSSEAPIGPAWALGSGHITDFHGRIIEEVVAGFDGEILYIIGTPPVTKGEPVAMIGGRQ